MFFSKKLQKFKNLKHCFFSRKNGVSRGIYDSLNCGIGSHDNKENVLKNLELVSKKIGCKKDLLITLNQKHSNKVIYFENKTDVKNKLHGDAIISRVKNVAIGILAADCAPILIYEKYNKIIGCIHAGWKGALNEIIENTLEKLKEMGGNQKNLIVSIGPCISKENYEVKNDFYLEFSKKSKNSEQFFSKNNKNTFNFDLRAFVNSKFKNFNIQIIDNILIDSFSNENECFSFRRASKLGQQDYGRCISVIKKI